MRIANLLLLIPVVLTACAEQVYITEEVDPAADAAMDVPASPSVDSQIREQQLQERGLDYGEMYKDVEENAPNLGPNAPGYVPPPPD